MTQSFSRCVFTALARKPFLRTGLLGAAILCAQGAWAQEVVSAMQITPHRVTQVVVGGEKGLSYVMSTLQQLSSDVVLVTPSMAQSAKPFSVVHNLFTPVASLAQVPANQSLNAVKLPVNPGFHEVHAHSFNTVYEVIYQHSGRWMVVETTEAPEHGMLELTDDVKKASRTLWTS